VRDRAFIHIGSTQNYPRQGVLSLLISFAVHWMKKIMWSQPTKPRPAPEDSFDGDAASTDVAVFSESLSATFSWLGADRRVLYAAQLHLPLRAGR